MISYIADMGNKTQIRLASYNMRKCVGLDRRRRPERIVQVLNSLDADIIALQEADRRLGARPAALPARLIEAETDFSCVALPGAGPSLGWHGNAVLLRKGLKASRIRPLELPGTEPRGAVMVEIDGRINIVATHLGLLRRNRRQQLEAICRAVANHDLPTAIVGDFNEWSRQRGLEPLAADFSVHSPGRSYHAARPVAALDRVALGAGLTLVDGGVCETALARIASDHLPIWVDVALNASAAADNGVPQPAVA